MYPWFTESTKKSVNIDTLYSYAKANQQTLFPTEDSTFGNRTSSTIRSSTASSTRSSGHLKYVKTMLLMRAVLICLRIGSL